MNLLEIFFLELEFVGPPMMLLLLVALYVLFWVWSSFRLSWRSWFKQKLGFLWWWQVGLGFSEFAIVACCVTRFICSSSGASNRLNSNSLSRYETVCSYLPFSQCAWLRFFQERRHFGIFELLQMRPLLASEVLLKNQSIFGSLGWKPVIGVCVSPSQWIGVWRIFCRTQSWSLPCCLCWDCWCSWTPATHHYA